MITDILTYPSPIGMLTLAADGSFLCGLWMEGQKHFGGVSWNSELLVRHEKTISPKTASSPILNATTHWLDQYFNSEKPSIESLLLLPQGTDFQRRVWKLLCDIPYGETTTYGELAQELKTSARAVGTAVGRNPIGIIIPCHRVIGADGQLTGYAGAIERKVWLLEFEKTIGH